MPESVLRPVESPQHNPGFPTDAAGRSLPSGLRLYRNLILLITALSLLSLVYYHHIGRPLADVGLWSAKDDRYSDLWKYRDLFKRLHTAAFFSGPEWFAYPAPCAVVYRLIFALGPHALGIYLSAIVLCALTSVGLFVRVLVHRGISVSAAVLLGGAMVLTSEPWFILLNRANLELVLYLLIAGGVWAYLKGHETLAAVLWACAGAMKLYPVVLLAMFLYRRTLRQFLAGAATFIAVTVASVAYVGPTMKMAAMETMAGVGGFVTNYAANARRSELNGDHSLLGAIKEILSLHMLRIGQNLTGVSHIYEAAVAVFCVTLYFLVIRRQPKLNQLCVLLLCIVVVPPVSYDYTLTHTYLVFGIVSVAYIEMPRAGRVLRHASLYFVLFALLSTSLTWFHFRGLGFNGMLKAAAIVTLIALLLRQPLTIEPERNRFEGNAQPA